MTTSEEELEKQIRKSIGMRERDRHDALIDFVGSKILKGKLKELSDKSRELFVEDLLLILASAQRSALEPFRRAIMDKGSHPRYHDKQVRRLKEEWPVLYRLLATLKKDGEDNADS